jgi:hypothetical protein
MPARSSRRRASAPRTTFVLDDGLRERCAALRRFAEQPEHWYRPGITPVPGTDRRHVVQSGDVQACFSWTVAPFGLLRHLSVSIRAWHEGHRTLYAKDEYVFTLAHLLGFTGAEPDARGIVMKPAPTWRTGMQPEEGTVVVQELIELEELN